jgi:uncharacterized protein (DUF3820 family)
MNFPRGKYNGRRIVGLRINTRINLLWWSNPLRDCYWSYGELGLHIGCLHMWISAEYEL